MSSPSVSQIRSRISQLLARPRDYRQEIRALVDRYPYVVFYGCGAILNSIVESWSEHIGRKIDYCCDSNSGKWGKFFCGAKCLSPKELATIKDKCAVFVTIGNFRPVYDALRESGFPSVNLLYKYDLVASEFLAHHDREAILAKLCETYELLDDRQSRNVFDAVVSRVLGDGNDISVMPNICEGNQYFPPDVIALSEHERLVDIGAYNGDTILDFVARTQGRFDQVFAYEVDAINFKALNETVRQMPECGRIQISNLGIWDSECDITYSIGESQSTVGAGESKGHVVPLDDILYDERVTFIKMDIEGAEPRALTGARRIIQGQRPQLAICIYHSFRHLWEIPLYIKSLVPEYKIYLRHHTNLEYETVCYARCQACQAGPRP